MPRKLSNWYVDLVSQVDIQVGGARPWDVQVLDESFMTRVMAQGSLGLGETYVEGLWECQALDQFFDRFLSARLHKRVRPNFALIAGVAKAKLLNLQDRKRSQQVAQVHYDLGNDFYAAMLDPWMQYTCGYWSGGAETLEAAQEAKLDMVCRKLDLQPGDRVLELGCGWGGFAKFAASRYGASVVAYNISKEQVAWARESCKGLPVEIRLADYRDAEGTYDKVASIGMCEHVGHKNYRKFLRLVHDRLKPGGIFLLHTIGGIQAASNMEPWLDKYIFPGSALPSPAQLGRAMDGLFVLEDWHNFGVDYDRTLMAWHDRFEASWPNFRERYGEAFHRMWRYYLLCCAATFRSRYNQLFQCTLSKDGIRGGWKTAR